MCCLYHFSPRKAKKSFPPGAVPIRISLCNLCVFCVSVVQYSFAKTTIETHTEVAQRKTQTKGTTFPPLELRLALPVPMLRDRHDANRVSDVTL